MKKLLSGWLGVLVVGVLAGYGVSWYFQQPEEAGEEIRVVIADQLPPRELQLYFTEPQGAFLTPESREIPACDEDRDCIERMLSALIDGSLQNNLPVLPKQTKILAVDVENDLVRVDFSRHLTDFHPGGSLTELLSIYSLANSLNENFPYVRQLQILIEGEVRQTLKGHARIDQPIYADFSFSDPPLMDPLAEPEDDNPSDQGLSIEMLIQNNASQGENSKD